MASVQGLVHRDQASNSIPNSTVNTVIAVTVILGVIFIAFALFVIYWMYMRSIDRQERRDRERRDHHAQLEMSRKRKPSPSRISQKDRRSKSGVLVEKDRRPRRGSGWFYGKCKSVITLFTLIIIMDQGGLKGTRRGTLRTRSPDSPLG